MQYKSPKGVFDILPYEAKTDNVWRQSDRWLYLENIIRECTRNYGYKEIRTPIFETADLFVRSSGETSDIISKEMYTFVDKANRPLALRPEGTAAVIRSFIENHLYQTSGLHKYFYIGPMFRYERPQAGRYRQHHQFGAEAIGIGSPEQDVETIELLYYLYKKLGLSNLRVLINTVGDCSTRQAYKHALREYLSPHFNSLSEDSQIRFERNILRILDSKDPGDQKILEKAPTILNFLSEKSSKHFERVQELLKKQNILFKVDPKLVRGLDYYNETVFEILSEKLGAQNTIGAGGRYDGLIQSLGGPSLPSVGFATGLERLLQIMEEQKVAFPQAVGPLLFLIPLGKVALNTCFDYLCRLRHQGFYVEMDFSEKKIQYGFQMASSLNASYVAVIGDQELSSGYLQIKNLSTRESKTLPFTDLEKHLKGLL